MVKLGRTESPALSERAQRLAVAVEAACQEPSLGGGEIEEVVLSDREAFEAWYAKVPEEYRPSIFDDGGCEPASVPEGYRSPFFEEG